MKEEKWIDIKAKIQEKFGIESNETEKLSQDIGGGTCETIVFSNPLGKMKFEFTIRPMVIDKKTHYSLRASNQTKVDYIYDPNEKIMKMQAFKLNEDSDEWEPFDASSFE